MKQHYYYNGQAATMGSVKAIWDQYTASDWDREHADEVFALALYEDHPLAEDAREKLIEAGIEIPA